MFDAAKILYGLIATGLIRLHETGRSRRRREAGEPRGQAARPGAALRAPSCSRSCNRVRDACNDLLGSVGESVVNKHYQKAQGEIEKGAGVEAIEEAINQIARAASILKGAVDDRGPARAAQGPALGTREVRGCTPSRSRRSESSVRCPRPLPA